MDAPAVTRAGVAVVAALALAVGGPLAAQDRGRWRRGDWIQTGNAPYDGRMTFVRLRYGSAVGAYGVRREPPWAHDYPTAERNLMLILNEITLVRPFLEGGNIYATDDPELFRYPVAYMSEPGAWTASDAEIEGLRRYLLKGGFVIFDDFRGYDLENFAAQMHRVLPGARLIPLDATHPIFHSFFDIKSLDFVQMYDRGLPPIFYGIFEDNDPAKRLMVIANYNNDIGEYLEYSATGLVPVDLSNEAYKFATNYIIYAMTH